MTEKLHTRCIITSRINLDNEILDLKPEPDAIVE